MEKKIKAPVIQERATYYPRNAVCPWCKKKKLMEPHSMAILTSGALAKVGRGAYAGPIKGLKGMLSFQWHRAHDDGEGDHRDKDVSFDIARDVYGGLFDLMFCSVKCLRGFLNSCLDDFESRIEKAKPVV